MKQDSFIIFSTADWDNPFWTNKQHIASRLAKRGYKVLYIESLGLRTPTVKAQDLSRIIKRILSFFKGTRRVNENIWVYSPLVIPLHKYKIIKVFNDFLLKAIIKYFQFKLKIMNPIIWTYNPTVYKLIKRLSPSKVIYHSVDDLSATPGIDPDMIKEAEKNLLSTADITFCTSLNIAKKCRKMATNEVYYHSNVVDYDHFSKALSDLEKPSDLKDISNPILGFVGAISEYKVDMNLILQSAVKNPQWNWVLIGKIGEGQPLTSQSKISELKKLNNVHFLGPKDYAVLPNYIKYFDVCTIPTPSNNYTNSMFPMKFYEFMATEKPIVAKNIDSLKEVTDSHYSYDTIENFEKTIELALDKGVKSIQLNRQLSQENTWENRLDKMLNLIFNK